MLCYHLFDCPRVNFGPLSTFAPWKGRRRTWKIYFPLKNGFSIKNLFWAILGSRMMASLNSECNISIHASISISIREHKYTSLLALHRVVRNISDVCFTFTERLLEKMVLPSEAILKVFRLYPLIVLSSSRDYISSSCYAFT